MLVLRVPGWLAEALCSFPVALTDEHLTFIVLVWRSESTAEHQFQIIVKNDYKNKKKRKESLFFPSQLTGAGDLPVFLITGVVVELGVRVVQNGPTFRVLHSITVTLVVHLAAPTGQTRQVFKHNQLFFFSCSVQYEVDGLWPIQIINRCAWASQSTVAAVVGVVQCRPAIRHQTQDHPPELVQCFVV